MKKFREIARSAANFGPGAAQFIGNLLATIRAVRAAVLRPFMFPAVSFGKDVKLIGLRGILIAKNSVIGSGTWININCPVPGKTSLRIGENSFVGQDNFFSVGSEIVCGPYLLTARNCSFVCSTHIYSDPLEPYLKTGTSATDSITIGANCFFGLNARVVGNINIGHGCVIGAGADVRHDVPPFSLVAGAPARIIKRYDFSKRVWVRWPAEDYVEGPNELEYIGVLRNKHGWIIHPIAAARRGFFDVV